MKLEFIALDKLAVGKANMRYAKKAPDVSDILPTVRKRGVLVPVLVRPACVADDQGHAFEIVAGARRFHAACLVAEERRALRAGGGEQCGADAGEGCEPERIACAILDEGDDAMAIEASLIENVARRDPDEVTQWETFTRLVKEGQDSCEIAATFGMPDLAVRRILALGNLMPRIRDLYRREAIDAATVRHLTLASKSRQRDWLAVYDDPETRTPTGQGLKGWLLGGETIPVRHALFDAADLAVVADLFGEDAYFTDRDAFWNAQNAAIEARRLALLEDGWSEVIVVAPGEAFHSWEYEKTAKRSGGRVYVDLRASGEAIFHEGYLTRKEVRAKAKGEAADTQIRPPRPELTSTLAAYVDLHRHAAARAALLGAPGIALRLMVAHAAAGSPLWTLRPEPQTARHEAVAMSIAESKAEAEFDKARVQVLRLLGRCAEDPTVTGGSGDAYGLVALFLRLLALTDAEVMAIVAVVMGETLAAGSPAVDALGSEIGLDMARFWQADEAFFTLLRDREVLAALVGEVAGPQVAEANAREKGKTLRTILGNHLTGGDGRKKIEGWVPRWMAFPPAAYTARGGVGSVAAHGTVVAAREAEAERRGPGESEGSGEREAEFGAGQTPVETAAATPATDADTQARPLAA